MGKKKNRENTNLKKRKQEKQKNTNVKKRK